MVKFVQVVCAITIIPAKENDYSSFLYYWLGLVMFVAVLSWYLSLYKLVRWVYKPAAK